MLLGTPKPLHLHTQRAAQSFRGPEQAGHMQDGSDLALSLYISATPILTVSRMSLARCGDELRVITQAEYKAEDISSSIDSKPVKKDPSRPSSRLTSCNTETPSETKRTISAAENMRLKTEARVWRRLGGPTSRRHNRPKSINDILTGSFRLIRFKSSQRISRRQRITHGIGRRGPVA